MSGFTIEKSDEIYEYHVGAWGLIAMDPQGLQIYFDASGRLVDNRIVER